MVPLLVVWQACGFSSLVFAEAQPRAVIFEGMGNHTRAVTAKKEAQLWFNQGLTWLYGFNYQDATLCFQKAAELDDKCGMAWWGVAMAASPAYNHPVMNEDRKKRAWSATVKARGCLDHLTPVEQALIKALAKRIIEPNAKIPDRATLNKAYAEAMQAVWREFPNDSDVGTIYAESMMLLRPWQLYAADRTPHPDTPHIVNTLDRVLAMDPDHPGALHLYIHAVEPSRKPSMAMFAADRLFGLVPASSHLQHMPSHIYIQVGRWDLAVESGKKAMEADDEYRLKARKPGLQPSYPPHNTHMMTFAAMMSGRKGEALAGARDMWTDLPDNMTEEEYNWNDTVMCTEYDVLKRFGMWKEILKTKAPRNPNKFAITTANWHGARAVAYAALSRVEPQEKDAHLAAATKEYAAFKEVVSRISLKRRWGSKKAWQVLEVSDNFIQGEIALQQEQWDKAIWYLKRAIEVEDGLGYLEPPQWLQPSRHTLGAIYLHQKMFKEAEATFREDLAKWPDNGWSLFGLSKALKNLERQDEAEKVYQRCKEVWAKADVPLDSPCPCLPGLFESLMPK